MISWNQNFISQFHPLQSHYFALLAQVKSLQSHIDQLCQQNEVLRKNIHQIDHKTNQIQHLTAQNLKRTQKSQDLSKLIQTKKKTFSSLPPIPELLLEQKQQIHNKNNEPEHKKPQKLIKSFSCPYRDCQRIYKSSFSLNLHIKIYHNGGSKRQRQKFASIILEAQESGLETPQIPIKLPEGFLQEFRTSFKYMKKYKM